MKKTLLLSIAVLLLTTATYAQQPSAYARQFHRRRLIERIDLKEKLNSPLRNVVTAENPECGGACLSFPEQMLRAYRDGRLKGYYPNAPGAELSYADFLAYFRLARKIAGGDAGFNCCPDGSNYRYRSANGYNAAKPDSAMILDFFGNFDGYLEIIVDQQIERTASEAKRRPRFFRLLYLDPDLDPKNAMAIRPGVLFVYDDVVNLTNPTMLVANPKNQAANFPISTFFENQQYAGILIQDSDKEMQSIEQGQRVRKGLGAFEQSIWTY
jgi:hypothetical protein